MKEEWKVIKEFTSLSTCHLPNDKIYISNTGRIRLNDIELTIGNGLYVSGKKPEVHIVGCRFPYGTMYRTIYHLFNYDERLEEPTKYQIHHIDYNHINNSLDNLILLSLSEHGKIHAQDQNNNYEKQKEIWKQINELIKLKQKHIDDFILFLHNRAKEYKEHIKRIKEENRKLEREKKHKQWEEERQRKLDSGLYKLSDRGYLVCLAVVDKLKKSRKGLKEDESLKRKRSFIMKQYYEDNPEYRERVGEGVRNAFKALGHEKLCEYARKSAQTRKNKKNLEFSESEKTIQAP